MDKFNRRPGTSGISGQLYETKLISLILFRLLNEDSIEDFHIASNMDEIGAFDDVCLKLKIKNIERPLLILLQAKHKEKSNTTLDDKDDLAKWWESVTKTKEKFRSLKKENHIFNGKFSDIDCHFIIYTNAKYNFGKLISNKVFESSYASNLNKILSTGAVACQPIYTDKDVKDFGEAILKEEIPVLAENLGSFLDHNQSMNIMNNSYILQYHVILRQQVVNVSEIQVKNDKKYRILTFRQDFIENNDKQLALLRKHLYELVLKNRTKIKNKNELDVLISSFLSNPCDSTLIPLIENHISYRKQKLEFITKRPLSDIQQMEQVLISTDDIDKSKAIAAKNILLNLKLPVPVAFGNIDLAIRGTPEKIEQRLQHLTNVLIELFEKAKETESFLITIDDNIDKGLLSSNGGIGGGVGNIFDYDTETELLKFNGDLSSLQPNARFLYFKLKDKYNNLQDYRFDVQTMEFPRISFSGSNLAQEFLTKLVIYAKQSNHYELEEILKNEIKDHLKTNPQNIEVDFQSIFIHYHHVIQNWWLTPKTESYLSKDNNKFQLAIDNIVKEPQMSAIQKTFYIHKIKQIDYTFTNDGIHFLETVTIDAGSRTVIVTGITTLTTMKVIQYLRNKKGNNYAVVDLEYVMALTDEHFYELNEELRKTEKIIIVICNIKQDISRLEAFRNVVEISTAIIITNSMIIEIVNEYFLPTNIVYDKNLSLVDLTIQSRNNVIKKSELIFQDQKITWDLLVDDVSIEFIKGTVLNYIIRNETLSLGESLTSRNYEEIKDLYIERKVSQTTVLDENIDPRFIRANADYFKLFSSENYDDLVRNHPVETFYDIKNNAVLITASPGMGKSTLLTHLSLKTKELDKRLWIIRINLLEHSKQFYDWQMAETIIDSLETFKFICNFILKNHTLPINLMETENKIHLDGCTDNDWTTCVLKLFLHSYNNNRVIFLFDGFDEICPNYKLSVTKFFEVIKNYLRGNKMWVTSRPYCDILPDVKRIIGKSYRLEYIDDSQRNLYLKKIWQSKIKFEQLNDTQRNNVMSFITFMKENKFKTIDTSQSLQFLFRKVYYIFYEFILSNIKLADTEPGCIEPMNSYIPEYVAEKFSSAHTLTLAVEDDFFKYMDTRSAVNEKEDMTILGTPLLLYLIADYFVSLICNKDKTYEWEPYINVHRIYEMFIETKLKKILFEEKNKMNVYNPDIMEKYERDLDEYKNFHKQLATFLLFGSPIMGLLSIDELKKIDPLLHRGMKEKDRLIGIIKAGKERTGLISHLLPNNFPVYIHKTFTEYFAAEFLSDVFMTDLFELSDKTLLYATLRCSNGNDSILSWVHGKRKLNKKLDEIMCCMETKLPFLSSWYRKLFFWDGWSRENYYRLMASSEKDFVSISSFEYNKDCEDMFKSLERSEREIRIQNIRDTIIPNMKPHLKKYFEVPEMGECSKGISVKCEDPEREELATVNRDISVVSKRGESSIVNSDKYEVPQSQEFATVNQDTYVVPERGESYIVNSEKYEVLEKGECATGNPYIDVVSEMGQCTEFDPDINVIPEKGGCATSNPDVYVVPEKRECATVSPNIYVVPERGSCATVNSDIYVVPDRKQCNNVNLDIYVVPERREHATVNLDKYEVPQRGDCATDTTDIYVVPDRGQCDNVNPDIYVIPERGEFATGNPDKL